MAIQSQLPIYGMLIILFIIVALIEIYTILRGYGDVPKELRELHERKKREHL